MLPSFPCCSTCLPRLPVCLSFTVIAAGASYLLSSPRLPLSAPVSVSQWHSLCACGDKRREAISVALSHQSRRGSAARVARREHESREAREARRRMLDSVAVSPVVVSRAVARRLLSPAILLLSTHLHSPSSFDSSSLPHSPLLLSFPSLSFPPSSPHLDATITRPSHAHSPHA